MKDIITYKFRGIFSRIPLSQHLSVTQAQELDDTGFYFGTQVIY
jgi:hypothetical protein